MSADRIERLLPELLTELGQPGVPDYFDETLRRTARMRQRPRWTFPERWIPMDIATQVPVGARLVPLRTIIAVALLILALAVGAILIAGAQQLRRAPLLGPAGNGGVILSRDGDIYLAEPTLDRERLLIGGPENDLAARFSRDGTTIFFGRVSAEGTVVMAANADGSNVRPASRTPLQENGGVEVSPDGSRLLVINTSGPAASLEVHPLDAAGAPVVVDLGGITLREKAWWRGRGEEIVFVGSRSSPAVRGFYAASLDGSIRALFEIPDVDGMLNTPSISEDGRLAAYWNHEPGAVSGRTCNVHVVDLDSGRDRRLVLDPSAECETTPEFVGDGRLVVERSDLVDDVPSNLRLLVGPVDGSSPGRVIGEPWGPDEAIWWERSPDRTSILVVGAPEFSHVISLDDGTIRKTRLSLGDFVSWQRRPLDS